MKITFSIAILLFSYLGFAQVYLPAQSASPNSNVGINENSPEARLHISDDSNFSNCQPAILIDGNVGNTVGSGGVDPEGTGSEPSTCSTPYALRVYQNNGSARNLSFNLAASGYMKLGVGIDNLSAVNTLNVLNNMGIYGLGGSSTKLFTEEASNASLVWYNPNASYKNFEFRSGVNTISEVKVMSLAPTGQVSIGDINTNSAYSLTLENGLIVNEGRTGIGTQNPEANLHIVDLTDDPNAGDHGQIHGLLIETNRWRIYDYAMEVRTGYGKVFTIGNAGTVHIGNSLNWAIPDGIYKLWVEGGIRTERIKVDVANANGWADYVFDDDYKLMSIEELEAFIKKNKHLPGVPSAKEVVANGVDLGEMNKILLEKVEELTLRVIELEKKTK